MYRVFCWCVSTYVPCVLLVCINTYVPCVLLVYKYLYTVCFVDLSVGLRPAGEYFARLIVPDVHTFEFQVYIKKVCETGEGTYNGL